MNKLIVANWKMELLHNAALSWLGSGLQELNNILEKTNNRLVLCPAFTELDFATTRTTSNISIGAQDCAIAEQGAYTGDVSVLTLKEMGCTHVIVGHSERRMYHGETDDMVATKVSLLMKHALTPIVCIGESDKETKEPVLMKQLGVLEGILSQFSDGDVVIAYEPRWAIGSGITPSVQKINDVCDFIRRCMSAYKVKFTVLYGGSVNERTLNDLLIRKN